MNENVQFVQTNLAQNLSDVVINDPFYWSDTGLLLLPILFAILSLIVFMTGWRKKRKQGAAGTIPVVLLSWTIGVFLLDFGCLAMSVSRVLIQGSSTENIIHPQLLAYEIACMLRMFTIILPLTGLASIGSFVLSRKAQESTI
ncbi:MAG: hypothetical protein WCO42_10830 [bacterium]